jgi:hypothetical protein
VIELTDWEIGNEIKNDICDTLNEMFNLTKDTHPDLADVVYQMSNLMGYAANRLCDDGVNVRESTIIKADCYRLLAIAQDKDWWKRKTKTQ